MLAKSVAREVLSAGLYYTNIVNLHRFLRNNRGNNNITVLAYHNIGNSKYLNLDVPLNIFKMQVEYLIKNQYKIISLDEAVRLISAGESVSGETIVITFDDGYKSMFTSVFPVVKEYGIPVTIFITVGPMEKQFPLFIDALIFAVERTKEKQLPLSSLGLKNYSLDTSALKEKALYDINLYGKTLSNESRTELLQVIFDRLGVDSNSPELKEIMLSWDEAKEMAGYGVTFGAHTVSHPVLSRIPLSEVRQEIDQSKQIIEQRLGADVRFFAYPYGLSDSFTDDVVRIVQQSEFAGACTLLEGKNMPGDNVFLLKRTCMTHNIILRPMEFFSKAVFAAMISGLWHSVTFKRMAENQRT